MTGPIIPEELSRFVAAAPGEWGCRFGYGKNDPRHYSGIFLSPVRGCLMEIRVGEDCEPTDGPLFIGWSTGWLIERGTPVMAAAHPEGDLYCVTLDPRGRATGNAFYGPTLAIAHFRCVLAVLEAEKEKPSERLAT